MTTETRIRKLLEDRYPTRSNAGDIDGYVALYSDDVVWSVPNLPDATSPGTSRSPLQSRPELRPASPTVRHHRSHSA